ncbi:MAG TPA: hypothetical protein ENK02_06510 [Planctomycetes bacterium]|nr:hypothetical protein [Planctomycetota bacterium]
MQSLYSPRFTSRLLWGASLLLAGGISSGVLAQDPRNPVVGRVQAYSFASPQRGNPGTGRILVFEKILRFPKASFLQVGFSRIQLEEGSLLMVESLFDDARQTWKPGQAAEVGLHSVYFNGDAIRIRLFAGPGTRKNSFAIKSLAVGFPTANTTPLTLCGTDTRTRSFDRRVARLMLQRGTKVSIATGFLISRVNCFATAGHALSGTQVVTVQFDVPLSTSTGTRVNPPPSSQYLWEGNSNSFRLFENNGPGKDWGVFTTLKNSLTQRYPGRDRGDYFRFGAVPSKGLVQTFGHGIDTTPLSFNTVQQRSTGPILFRFPSSLGYRVPTQPGSSGGPITYGASNLVVAVHTNGGCDSNPKTFNRGTRQDYLPFVQARKALCTKPIRPDLRALKVGAPSILQAGGTATFTSKIRNVGTKASPAVTSAYVLSKNLTISVSDRILKTFTTRKLGLGEIHNHSTFVPLPRDLEEGDCYIGVIADFSKQLVEETESNNSVGAKRVCRGLPDLMTLSAVPSRTQLLPRQSMNLALVIVNAGKRASTRVNSGVYLSTDSLISKQDTLLASFVTPALSPKQQQRYKSAFQVPSQLPSGTCYIGVLADREGRLPEITRRNNALSTKVFCGPKPLPDLVPTALGLSTKQWSAGAQLALVSTTSNLGKLASSATTSAYYFSQDKVLSSKDILLLSYSLPPLRPRTSYQHRAKVKLPAKIPSGPCYIGVWADSAKRVLEETESNNTKVLQGSCVGKADLSVSFLQFSPVGPGQIFAIRTDFKNIGTAAAPQSRAGVLLSTDSKVDLSDLYLGTIFVPALGAGKTYSVTSLHRLPFRTPAGRHYLGAMVDVHNWIPEFSETNNVRALPLQIATPYQGKARALEFLPHYGSMAKGLGFATYSSMRGGRTQMEITAPSLRGSWYYCMWSRSPNFVFDDLTSISVSYVNTPLFNNWLGKLDAKGSAVLSYKAPAGIKNPQAIDAYTHVFFFDSSFQTLLGPGDHVLRTLITK